MHGVRRTRHSAEALEAKRQKEAEKLKEYLALQDALMTKKNLKSYTKEDLDLTTKVLRANPELYTAWNYRRDILVNGLFPLSSPEDINNHLASDLQLTLLALKQNPKVYWIWNHRRWCLESTPDGPDDENEWKRTNWARELAVVEKMLDADARNFHAWDYRRYVISSSPDERVRSPAAELTYTKRKIQSNFSNFSAWHQRSKTLSSLWENGQQTEPEVKEAEFELLKPAMYMDHNDQSVWMYHRWLIGSGDDPRILEREVKVIKELLELEGESKWCLESLVHYQRLLARHEQDTKRRDELINECRKCLQQLKEIDPKRRRRYEELESQVESH